MLSYTNTNNRLSLELVETTDSYDPDLCEKYLGKYFDSADTITALLKSNIEMTGSMDDTDNLKLADLDSISSRNPLWLFSECVAPACGIWYNPRW